MTKWLFIAFGSALGGVARYGLQGWVQRWSDDPFPVGTLVVNVAGCFLIGLLNAALTGPFLVREEYRLALTVGLLGGFTTFSAFGWETLALANDAQWARAILNVCLSIGFGLSAAWLGYRLAVRWFGV